MFTDDTCTMIDVTANTKKIKWFPYLQTEIDS